MVDDLPVDEPEAPAPRLPALSLLVGRVVTIKLAYWALVTVAELALPLALARPFDERFRYSVGIAVAASLLALSWARRAARAPDRRAGAVSRSIPAIATTFAAATVVASPASLPLLLVERERSFETCVGQVTCHPEALVLWVAVMGVGFLVIPSFFAVSLPAHGR